MKISPHKRCWIFGRAVGVALIVSLSSFVLPARVATYYADEALGDNGYDGLSNVVVNGYSPKLNVYFAINAASRDPDSNRYFNVQKYLAGMKPRDPPSYPRTLGRGATCFTNRYSLFGTNFLVIAPWSSQGIFFEGDTVTISNRLGTTIEVYDYHSSPVTNLASPGVISGLTPNHYFVQVDGINGGVGDRAQFVVLPRHYTNTWNMLLGSVPAGWSSTDPILIIVSSSRFERLRCGWVRFQQFWGPETTNGYGGITDTNGVYHWTPFDLVLQRHTNGVLAVPTRVLNITGIGHTTNSTVFLGNGTPLVDQTNSVDSWVHDVSLLYSNAARRYGTSYVYEILNEPQAWCYFSNDTVLVVSMAVSASVQAVKFVCPACITWAPAAQAIDTPNVWVLTNAPAPLYYAKANVISWHGGATARGPVDANLTYTNIPDWNWGTQYPADTEVHAIASLFEGKGLAISETYPHAPDPLGRSNTWWNLYLSPTSIAPASLTWYDLSTRYWKSIVMWSAGGVTKLLPWLGTSNQQEDYEGWSGDNSHWTNGFGPNPTISGNAILGWWLNEAVPLTNWLSGSRETWANPRGGRTGGVPGLHFFEFRFANGTTNTFVWADEDTQITTNFGVGLTDIFSNSWTDAIGKEPVIAWGWPKP